MKNLFLTLCLSIGLGATGFSQSGSFQKTIDLGGDDYANMSIQGDSGSHYFVGSTSAPGGGGYDAFIAKVDADGHFLWEKQYGGSGTEYGTAMIRTNDDNLLLVGRSNSYSSSPDMFIVKTDLSGNVLWAKVIGTDSVDYALNVAEGPDGYLVVGQTKGSTNGAGRWDAPMIKLDANGNVIWTKSFGAQFGNEVAYEIKSIGTDGWVLAGYTGVNNIGLNDGVFCVLDTGGSMQAVFEVGDSSDEDIRKMVLGENSVYFVGSTRSFHVGGGQDIFIAKYDISGNLPTLSWFKTYGDSGSESVTDAQTTPDNQIVVTALSSSYPGGDNGLIFVVDTAGEVMGAKVIGSAGSDVAMGVEISDNPVFIGYSNSYNGGGDNDIYCVRPDDNFGLGCHSFDTTFTAVTRTVTTLGPAIVDFSIDNLTVNEVSPTNLTFTNTAIDTSLCDTATVGIHELNTISVFGLYPNPAQQQVTLAFNNPTAATLTYSILNLYGSVVYTATSQENAGFVNRQLDVSKLAAGTYFVKIENGETSTAKRLMIMK